MYSYVYAHVFNSWSQYVITLDKKSPEVTLWWKSQRTWKVQISLFPFYVIFSFGFCLYLLILFVLLWLLDWDSRCSLKWNVNSTNFCALKVSCIHFTGFYCCPCSCIFVISQKSPLQRTSYTYFVDPSLLYIFT